MTEQRPPIKRVANESGIEIKPVYTADDVAASGGLDMLGRPGEYPFTRGIHPMMYRHRPWTMRQYAGFGNPRDTNQRFKYLIENGQTGLNVAFDLPTQCGYDSDDPMAEGEVGRVGMAIDSLRDMEIAFDGIDLNAITVSLTINGSAAILIAMYLAMAEKRGFSLKTLRGTAQNDILKEFIGRGTWIYPVAPSIKLVGDTIEYCAQHAPKYSPVSVCGYHIRESGANPAQEMAFAFCIAKAYADDVLKRGLDIDEFAGRLSFNFNIYGNIFEQVAKFRAYTIPTEFSMRVSLRTMQILIEEMGLTDTVDPLGGSYYVETLTNQMRDRMRQIMADVDAQGGIVKLVSEGIIQAQVSQQAYKLQQDIAAGAFRKVGVNCYRVPEEEKKVELHPYREEDVRMQVESLRRVRSERDGPAAQAALARVGADARAGVNVMPAIVDAVKAYATVGEITKELVAVYGRYREPIRF